MFQLGGPRSLEVIEAATGEDFHDLAFGAHRLSSIDGMEVRIIRIGMAGSLAYEVHGNFKDSIPVYNAILKAGQSYGIRRLGRHAYWNCHTENGFPQFIIHFAYAWEKDKDFMKYLEYNNIGQGVYSASRSALTGSCGPDLESRFFNPIELGWGPTINYNHDFVGKEALEKIKNSAHREMVTLVWNPDDILDIYRSEFEKGEPYAQMEGPEDTLPSGGFEYRADKVLVGDKHVGISTGRIFSWFYREMISLAVVDAEYSAIGTEVIVLWGDPGTRQKKIRAKVNRFPYMNIDRNETLDVITIPSGLKK
jgi:glycine cleavage system aminomethyltransferase T